MTGFRTFTVSPKIPENLTFLQTLANNVWWSWNIEAASLFRRISPSLFREAEYNPLRLLALVGQTRLEELSADTSFLAHMEEVRADYEESVLTSRNWRHFGDTDYRCIAYFSMEFGLHESIHIYSGGLGILAGDGKELEIGFNVRYLADALRVVPSEEVTLELTNGLSPIVLTPVDDKYDFAYMVLPVRIKNA